MPGPAPALCRLVAGLVALAVLGAALWTWSRSLLVDEDRRWRRPGGSVVAAGSVAADKYNASVPKRTPGFGTTGAPANATPTPTAVLPSPTPSVPTNASTAPNLISHLVPPPTAATAPLPPGGGPVPVVLQRSRASWLPRAAHLTHACLRAGRTVLLVGNTKPRASTYLQPNFHFGPSLPPPFNCSADRGCSYLPGVTVYLPKAITNVAHDFGDVFFATYAAFLNLERRLGGSGVRLLSHPANPPDLWLVGLAQAAIGPSQWAVDNAGGLLCFEQLLLGGKDRHLDGWGPFRRAAALRALRAAVARRLALARPPAAPPAVVLFHRAGLTSRRVLNPDFLTASMEALLPHPVRLTALGTHPQGFAAQAALFFHADVFVGVVGASQTTAFMMADTGAVVELCPCRPARTSWLRFQERFSAAAGNYLALINCPSEPDPRCDKGPEACSNHRNFSFNVTNATAQKLATFLRQRLAAAAHHTPASELTPG